MATDSKKNKLSYPQKLFVGFIIILWLFSGVSLALCKTSDWLKLTPIVAIGTILIISIVASLIAWRFNSQFNHETQMLHTFLRDVVNGVPNASLPEKLTSPILVDIGDFLICEYERRKTDLMQKEKEQTEALAKEQERLKQKRILANNMNHEIKTPIGIVQGYLDTLISHPDIDEETRTKFLEKCMDNIDRLQKMVYSLSVITRLEDGRSTYVLERNDLGVLINTSVNDAVELLKNRGFDIECDVPQNGLWAETNSEVLHAIMDNIVKNSVHYSKGNKVFIKYLGLTDGMHKFSIGDNGVGLPEEHLEHIFDRFYRVNKDKSRYVGGSGLGLSIAKDAVELHNGTIYAHNREEGGLEFVFTIKACQ